MTRDDIIRMAREAGWSGLYLTYNEPTGKADWQMVKESLTVPVTMEQIERFAALVAAAEREKWEPVLAAVIREMPLRLVRHDGNAPGHGHLIPGIWDDDNGALAGTECAWCKTWNIAVAAIRARGQA